MLSIEYRKIGLLPTCVGNERIRISEDGHVYHSRNTVECEEGEEWAEAWNHVGQLDAGDVSALDRDVRATGLLELDAEIVDETAEGGKREELDVVIDGKRRRFIVQNADPPAFRETVALVWGAKSMADLSAGNK